MTNHDKAEQLNAEILRCNEAEEIYKKEQIDLEDMIARNNQKRLQLQIELDNLLKLIPNE